MFGIVSQIIHDGHRAVDDCFALIEAPALGDRSRATPRSPNCSWQVSVRGFASLPSQPFEVKDCLKVCDFRWSDESGGQPKSWWVEVADDVLDDELRY